MVIKTFCIVSESGDDLTADMVAEALLQQVTLNSKKSKDTFAVFECENSNKDNWKAEEIPFKFRALKSPKSV